MKNGFVIVASCKHFYYNMAILCAESLKDYYPEAHVTLFTHEEWVCPLADIFDKVVTGIPNHKRAKLWALSKTDYDNVMYLDADCEIMHEDIAKVFDTLGDDDIKTMKTRDYCSAVTNFPAGRLDHHMGVFAYKNTPEVKELFDQWYEFYFRQQIEWDLDRNLYPPEKLRPWDIFTFWRLLNIEGWDKKVKVGYWENDARWNFHGLGSFECPEEDIIVLHHTYSGVGQPDARDKPKE